MGESGFEGAAREEQKEGAEKMCSFLQSCNVIR